MSIKPRKQKLNPDQIPLITPDSAWKMPTELPDLRRVVELAIDTETNDGGLNSGMGPGWVYRRGHICGVSVAWRWGPGGDVQSIYVPVQHPDSENFQRSQVALWLNDITRENRVKMFNAPYDCGWMKADLGVDIPPFLDDGGCMAVMVDENRRSFSLDNLCADYGITGKDETLLREAAVVHGVAAKDVKKHMGIIPARYVGPYAEQDAVSTLLLCEKLEPKIKEQRLEEAYRLEMDLIPMVQAMRWRGIRMDVDYLTEAKNQLLARSQRALATLSERIGTRVGMDEILSPLWLRKSFDSENVPFHTEKDEQTKEDKASFAKDWMRQGYVGRYEPGRQGHWLPLLIAEAKQCEGAAERFVQGFLLNYANNGRIHASVNQFRSEGGGTRSHRFSYSDPPLQQMPSRPESLIKSWTLTEEIAGMIRRGFLPEEGEIWGSLDYSQQEYRLIVHYAALEGCSRAEEAAAKYVADPKTDFHNLVVELTGLIRQRAKDVNFAKSYGAGLWKFCQMTGMSEEEGRRTMEQYDGEMPFVKELAARCDAMAQKRGWIKLLDGARCHFDEWEAAYIDKNSRERGWREGWHMNACGIEEARERASGQGDRPRGAGVDSKHPWAGARLKRAYTHKAMNRLIQGGAARQMKLAMRECWREGITPHIQMHDELGTSFSPDAEGRGRALRMQEIMRDVYPARVPFLVDAEFGRTWGDAKHTWKEAIEC